MSRSPELPYWQVAWVRDTVAQRCGLYLGGPHENYLSSQVALRMCEMQLDFGRYCQLLQDSPLGAGELQTLIERLCIYETSFLRDAEHFQALARFILPQLARDAARTGRGRLRLLSAGCSTGQEAYSLAMTVEESRPILEDLAVEVVGIDVSGDALDRAHRGVYSEREIAPLEPWRRRRYFHPAGAQFEVVPGLHQAVRWLRCNLAVELPVTQVDVIFCRNVLIYFHGVQRDALVRNLVAALRRGGFLVTGYADSLHAYRSLLQPIRTNGTVIFRRPYRPAAPSEPDVAYAPVPDRKAAGTRSTQ
jgi:chemotaxis protein methyltransferase CheR